MALREVLRLGPEMPERQVRQVRIYAVDGLETQKALKNARDAHANLARVLRVGHHRQGKKKRAVI